MAALLSAKDLCKTYVIDKRQNNVLKNVNLERNKIGIRCWHPVFYSYSWRISESRFYGNGLVVNILFRFCFFCF